MLQILDIHKKLDVLVDFIDSIFLLLYLFFWNFGCF